MITKSCIYNKEKILNEIKITDALHHPEFIQKYYKLVIEDLNHKDSNYLDIFRDLITQLEIPINSLVVFLKELQKNKDYDLLNIFQSIKKFDTSLLNYPESLLNNNLKHDKKILINYELFERILPNFQNNKNINSLLKKISPRINKNLSSRFINEKTSSWENLIDLSHSHGLLVLSKILIDNDKIESVLFHEKSFLFKKRDFLLNLIHLNSILTGTSLTKKKEIIISLLDSPYPEINIKDLLLEYEFVKNKTSINLTKIKINGFHCVHAYISHLNRKIQENGANIKYPYLKMFSNIEKINNTPIDDSKKLVLPKDKFELINWGETLNNCIASYNDQLLNLKCILFGVVENNKLIGAIEWHPEENLIAQFVGHNNQQINRNLFQKVQNLLTIFLRDNRVRALNFKYYNQFELTYPETNDSLLMEFGFISKKETSSFFTTEFAENGITDKTSGIYIIEDPRNFFPRNELQSFLFEDFKEKIKNTDENIFIDISKLYILSTEFKYKRDLSHVQLIEISKIAKQYNKKVFIYVNNLKNNQTKYKLFSEIVLKINKLHTTDDFFIVESYPSVNQQDMLVFNIGDTPD